jgi:hypothetical protein
MHWTRLPPPVRPNQTDPAQWYDHSGSYDGGVTLLPDSQGGPTIVYDVIECKSCVKPGCKCVWGNGTACSAPCPTGQLAPDGTAVLTPPLDVGAPMDPPWMGIARAVNTSDKYLLEWAKDPLNPINFTGGPQTGGANPGSIWWNEELRHWDLLALSHGDSEQARVEVFHPDIMGKMYRYETEDPAFHRWTRKEIFAQTSGNGGQWFMRLPQTVDGSPPPIGSPTHILTSGDGGGFRFGDYHESNDSWVPATASRYNGVPIHGPDSSWMVTQNASGRVMNIGWATVCGGASALTTLREVKYDPKTRSLVANPVDELVGLRTGSLANVSSLDIAAGTTFVVPGTTGVDAAASADLELTFTLPPDGSPAIFGACVLVGPIENATTGEMLEQPRVQAEGGEGGPWRPAGLCGNLANSTGIPVLANFSAASANGTRSGTVSIGVTNTMHSHPVFVTIDKDEADAFSMRILVDKCE